MADGWNSTSFPPSYSEMSLSSRWLLSLRHGDSVCRWIKYYGIKIYGSGSLSSGASTLPGNGGRDNQQETGWYTKGGKRGKAAHTTGKMKWWIFSEWSREVTLPTCKIDQSVAGNSTVFFCLVMTATQPSVLERMGNLSLTQRHPVAEYRTERWLLAKKALSKRLEF